MAKLTPMMEQYFQIKNKYKDCILFYRLGDFYEMFYEDALTASRELEITLTGKNCGQEEKAPMCGVPFHSCEPYINKLVEKGFRVAICEQVEDPKAAKGIVKRDVIRVVTPGTNVMTQSLDESKNNFIMSVFCEDDLFGIGVCDLSTGEFRTTQVEHQDALFDEMNKFQPSEIICNDAFCICGMDFDFIKDKVGAVISPVASYYFEKDNCEMLIKEQYNLANLEGIGLTDYPFGVIASGALLQYLHETQKNSLSHLMELKVYSTENYMVIDSSTRRNLELCETLREKGKKGSLLWVLDKTKTAMGARKLRASIEQPLIEEEEILARYDAIEELNANVITREEIREYLNPVYDLERLLSKISYRTVNPRDMIALESSLEMLPAIRMLLGNFKAPLFKDLYDKMDALEDIYGWIHSAIEEEPPISVREGGIFKNGYHEEIDKLRQAKTEGKDWLANLEAKEKEHTGIKNLRIKYNKVFGYYFEVTKSFLDQVPENWIRKQTLTNAERYTTNELKEMEDVILGAEDRLYNLEYAVFCELRDKIFGQMKRIQDTASVIAFLDMLASLAYVAEHNQYVRPTINHNGSITIKEGRHPVIEQMMTKDMFIANDTYLDDDTHRVVIITGPNMAGKSTYMRQTALISLMAQIGCFVPAREADLSLVDRIFTRVGASDDLASGQSTFMVEMTEVANILHNATKDSLIILDEIGRGTSTFDGLSIAWSVVEHIVNKKKIGAKTLFATHYHELTELEGKLEGVQNYCIAVKEDGEDIVFLRKIVKGGADRSYGIQVARLAGVPDEVLVRAREIADLLEAKDANSNLSKLTDLSEKDLKGGTEAMTQLSIFDTMETTNQTDAILFELRDINLSNVTPMDAMNLVYKWQNKLKEQW